MKITLIRHGMTAGNLEKRYIGRTDQRLCPEGTAKLENMNIAKSEILVTSPMKRCIETAEILFPRQSFEACEEMRECDFGDFEGKTSEELSSDRRYQDWIDSNGEMQFPNGELPEDFRNRCVHSFEQITEKYSYARSIAFVVHGGTIMAIMAKYSEPHKDYYNWMTGNASGWVCDFDGHVLINPEKI
ncbi:MAG: histidine phosphatase family protein [Oscillospiraceae bacterium]|nr:histidine phosphatase family protein [Oscillospiraceae bacterium]